MAHLAVGFVALGLLALVLAVPWTAPLLVIPVTCVRADRPAADRGRHADRHRAHAVGQSHTMRWADIEGLRFVKGVVGARGPNDGEDLRLPAVTFATLPLLTEASGGRVPNPYGSVAG